MKVRKNFDGGISLLFSFKKFYICLVFIMSRFFSFFISLTNRIWPSLIPVGRSRWPMFLIHKIRTLSQALTRHIFKIIQFLWFITRRRLWNVIVSQIYLIIPFKNFFLAKNSFNILPKVLLINLIRWILSTFQTPFFFFLTYFLSNFFIKQHLQALSMDPQPPQ